MVGQSTIKNHVLVKMGGGRLDTNEFVHEVLEIVLFRIV